MHRRLSDGSTSGRMDRADRVATLLISTDLERRNHSASNDDPEYPPHGYFLLSQLPLGNRDGPLPAGQPHSRPGALSEADLQALSPSGDLYPQRHGRA